MQVEVDPALLEMLLFMIKRGDGVSQRKFVQMFPQYKWVLDYGFHYLFAEED